MLRPYAKAPELDLHTMTEDYLDLRAPARAVHRRHAADRVARARRRRPRASSRAPRARCSTSTTARIRSSPRRTRSPAPPATGRGRRARRASTRSGASPRPTPRASAPGPFPTELDDALGAQLREAGGEFGTTTGRARRSRLDRPRRAALRRRASTGSPAWRSRSSTCSAASTRSTSACATAAPRARASTTSPTTSRSCTRRTATTIELPGWDEDITRMPLDRRAARERPGLPRLHLGLPRRPDRDGGRRPGPRPDDLDRSRGARAPRAPAARTTASAAERPTS